MMRDPMELLARLAGRTSWVLRASRTAAPITPQDIAHALAASPEKLGGHAAIAIACQRKSEWRKVEQLGYARFVDAVAGDHRRAGIIAGEKRYRARAALYDSFIALLRTQKKTPIDIAAREAHCNVADYRFLRRVAESLLQGAANAAAADACAFLFGEGLVRAVIQDADSGELMIFQQDQRRCRVEKNDDLIDALLDDMARGARVRRPGVLHLRACG